MQTNNASTDLAFKIETGACLWEHALNLIAQDEASPLAASVQKWRDEVGTADVRLTILAFVDECIAEWAKVESTFTACYDWDFVPAFLERKLQQKLPS